MNENPLEKIKNFLQKNIMLIIIALVCLTYVITGMISIEESGKSIIEIVGGSVIVFLFSYFVIEAFSLQGIINGKNSKIYLDVLENHKNIKDKVLLKSKYLNDWIKNKNHQIEYQLKTEFLLNYGLNYEDIMISNFDKSKLDKKQKKAIKYILKRKISKLTTSILLGENSRKNDPLYLGKDIKSYVKESNVSNLFVKITFTLIFGYFTTSFINFDIGDMIWKLFQVVLFLIVGIMEYFKSYMFVTSDYVDLINKKINYLTQFLLETDMEEKEC